MRKLATRILTGIAVVACLVILVEPSLLIALTIIHGSRVTSVEIAWDTTLIHTAKPATDPFQFGFIQLSTSRVILWGIVSLMLISLASIWVWGWMWQTGVLKTSAHGRKSLTVNTNS